VEWARVAGRLLDSLEAQTVPVAELLVVDNGSSDGAPELAARRGARVIPMGRNAGFAAAVNRGSNRPNRTGSPCSTAMSSSP